jgi:hypothetical protein
VTGEKPIHDVDEFLSVFKVGDEFSVINSLNGNPHSVSTLKIRGFLTHDNSKSSLHGAWKVKVYDEPRDFVYETFIGDLVNNLHGCFRYRSYANRELENRLYRIQEPKNNEQIDRLIQLIEELIAEL